MRIWFPHADSPARVNSYSIDLEPGSVVVCVVTGHGLKDPDTAARWSPEPVAVDPDPDAIEAASR